MEATRAAELKVIAVLAARAVLLPPGGAVLGGMGSGTSAGGCGGLPRAAPALLSSCLSGCIPPAPQLLLP